MGEPDSVYAWFNIIRDICQPAPCYLNSDKVFIILSNHYRNPEWGFEPGSSSECLLEFDTHSKFFGQKFIWGLGGVAECASKPGFRHKFKALLSLQY